MTDKYLDLTKVKDINDLKAIHAKMCEYDIKPMPSVSKINRILKNQYLTNGRTGYYEGDNR